MSSSLCLQKQYKASTNQIETLPDTISIFWRTHLQDVDFSENCLKELPSYIFELEVGMTTGVETSHICKPKSFCGARRVDGTSAGFLGSV